MTYQNDPKTNRPINRGTRADNNNYTGWIIGGVAVAALIVSIFVWTGRTNMSNTAAKTELIPPQATAPVNPTSPPSMTGSALPSAPAPR